MASFYADSAKEGIGCRARQARIGRRQVQVHGAAAGRVGGRASARERTCGSSGPRES